MSDFWTMIDLSTLALGGLYVSLMVFYGGGYLGIFWLKLVRRYREEFPGLAAFNKYFMIGAGIQLILIAMAAEWTYLENAANPVLVRIARILLRVLAISIPVYPVFLNSVLLVHIGRHFKWQAISTYKKYLIGLLPVAATLAAIELASIDPMQHPDIPFFAYLCSMVECLLASVWLFMSCGSGWNKANRKDRPWHGLERFSQLTGFLALAFAAFLLLMFGLA